jgi:DNA-binding winged helix-turn-helix (wHTH) protein
MKYRFLEFEIDQDAFALRRQGKPIAVEPRILDFLVYLIEHRQRMIPTSELLERVWSGAAVQPSAITRCVSLARGVLGQADAIRTIYGRGYQWVAPVRRYGAGDADAAGDAPAIVSQGPSRLDLGTRTRRERPGRGAGVDPVAPPSKRSTYRQGPTGRIGHARRSRPA